MADIDQRVISDFKIFFLCGIILSVAACSEKSEPQSASDVETEKSNVPEWKEHRWSGYEVVQELPHDAAAYTQGLFLSNGQWLESTGGYGTSSIRRVVKETGEVLVQKDLEKNFFGEGLAELDGKLYQLTWQSQKGFIYDAETLQSLGSFPYSGEGWGLTTDGESLIMSDGTDKLRFLDPKTFEVTREVSVTYGGDPMRRLNELEFIEGEIFANVWHSENIVRISPVDGEVLGVIDLTGIYPGTGRPNREFVLNGIAYDTVTKKLYVTGKCWPKIYQIRLVKVQ